MSAKATAKGDAVTSGLPEGIPKGAIVFQESIIRLRSSEETRVLTCEDIFGQNDSVQSSDPIKFTMIYSTAPITEKRYMSADGDYGAWTRTQGECLRTYTDDRTIEVSAPRCGTGMSGFQRQRRQYTLDESAQVVEGSRERWENDGEIACAP